MMAMFTHPNLSVFYTTIKGQTSMIVHTARPVVNWRVLNLHFAQVLIWAEFRLVGRVIEKVLFLFAHGLTVYLSQKPRDGVLLQAKIFGFTNHYVIDQGLKRLWKRLLSNVFQFPIGQLVVNLADRLLKFALLCAENWLQI